MRERSPRTVTDRGGSRPSSASGPWTDPASARRPWPDPPSRVLDPSEALGSARLPCLAPTSASPSEGRGPKAEGAEPGPRAGRGTRASDSARGGASLLGRPRLRSRGARRSGASTRRRGGGVTGAGLGEVLPAPGGRNPLTSGVGVGLRAPARTGTLGARRGRPSPRSRRGSGWAGPASFWTPLSAPPAPQTSRFRCSALLGRPSVHRDAGRVPPPAPTYLRVVAGAPNSSLTQAKIEVLLGTGFSSQFQPPPPL